MIDIMDTVPEAHQAIIIMVGNIGTGKSTATDLLLSEYTGIQIIAVSNDSITMMTGNGDYSRYRPMLSDMYKDMFFKCVCAGVDAGATVVCDNSHMTKRSRAKLIKIAKDAGISVSCINLGPGSPESLKRRQEAKDGRGNTKAVWNIVHQRFSSQYEEPSVDEGFDIVLTGDELRKVIDG